MTWKPGDRNCPECGRITPCACCTLWTGTKTKDGYGLASWGEHRPGKGYGSVLVHRWTYEQHHGPIPRGMVVMHICDQPGCYFVGHLRQGTYKENLDDCIAKGRWRTRAGRISSFAI